jgi:hypothetical protein
VTTATKVWTAVQWALNLAMRANPIGLVITALALLAAGLVIAYKKSETFRSIVDGAWKAIRDATVGAFGVVRRVVATVWGFISRTIPRSAERAWNAVTSAWNRIRASTRAVWDAVLGTIRRVVGAIVGAVRTRVNDARAAVVAAWNTALSRTRTLWASVVTAVTNKVDTVVQKARGLKDRITAAFAGAGGWLVEAGKAIVQGLIDGIMSKISALRAAAGILAGIIRDRFPGSPVKEGPLKSWNNGGAGKRLVDSLAEGMSDTRPVRRASEGVAREIAAGPVRQVASRPARSAGTTVNITINGALDPIAVGRQIEQIMVTYQRSVTRQLAFSTR